MALRTVGDAPLPGQVFAPWAVPDLAPCSPLCERVFPTSLIGLHRQTCARFDYYVLGVTLGQWPRHRAWA